MDIQFVDYDNVRFHLSTPTSKSSVMLSMGIQCWPDLVKYGAREHLQREYGEYLQDEGNSEPEYNVSLVIDLEKLPSSEGSSRSDSSAYLRWIGSGLVALTWGLEEKTALISKLALLKATAMSAPFFAAFSEQAKLQANYKDAGGAQQMDITPSEKKGELKVVKYREEEAIYIQASHDRVTIIFSTVFKEEADRVYGRVFLQVSSHTCQM